jgi:hypothetical protein
MRRNPLTLLYLLVALYAYWVVRQMGRGLGAWALEVPFEHLMLYRILPAVDVFSRAQGVAPARLAVTILMGPALAIVVGYVLLAVLARGTRRRTRGPWLIVCLISYLGLVLDPVHYAVVPLLRLGGEPEAVARLIGVTPVAITLPAMAVLGLDIMLARRRLVPLIKGGGWGVSTIIRL